jgi:hypothetical protein
MTSSTVTLADEMMTAGIRAVITCIDPKKLDQSFVGRFWDRQFLKDLPDGVDPCGENGEFHSFAVAGPMFEQLHQQGRGLAVTVGESLQRDGFVFCDVVPHGYDLATAAAEVEAARQEAAAAAAAAAAAPGSDGGPDPAGDDDGHPCLIRLQPQPPCPIDQAKS